MRGDQNLTPKLNTFDLSLVVVVYVVVVIIVLVNHRNLTFEFGRNWISNS